MKKLLTIICLLALATNSYAQENLQKIRINRFEGGQVSNSLADILEPNQGASLVNVVLDKIGVVSKRKGQELFVKDVGNTFLRGIGRFDPDAATSYLVAASGTNVIRAISSAKVWTLASPSTANLTAGQDTEFIQANDLLFILNGYNNTSWYDGATFTGGGSYPSSPPVARTGAWLRNYLFLAGGTSEPDWVYFSNNLEPTKYDASDIIKINTGDGQAIKHIAPFRLNELIIYKERSIFVLDITGVYDDGDWTVQPISTVIGTPAPRSVVSLGNDQWFLSSDPIAIRSLVRSSFDKVLVDMVSQPIQDIFDGSGDLVINPTYIDKAAAVLFDNKYILAIPTGTSTVNNTIVAYDFTVKGWYLITGWYPSGWVVFDKRLFLIDANDGRVVECFTGTTGDYEAGPGFIDSASVPSVGINFQYITRNIDFENPENYKILDALEVTFGSSGDYDATVYLSLDDSDWANLGTVNLAGDSRVLPAGLPVALSTAGTAASTFQTQKYGEWKKMSIRIENKASQETVNLYRISPFAVIKKWRRE